MTTIKVDVIEGAQHAQTLAHQGAWSAGEAQFAIQAVERLIELHKAVRHFIEQGAIPEPFASQLHKLL